MKYNIEGNINFYEELYKSLDDCDENKLIENTEKCCLITNEPLGPNFITLECNHTFNYMPLFNDIVNHKTKFNTMEHKFIKGNQLRCPYCRNIQKKLLPYIEGMDKINGVNYLNESTYISETCPQVSSYSIGVCQYVSTDNIACKCDYVKKMHLDNNTYCYNHYFPAIKKYNLDKKNKAIMAEKHKKETLKLKLKEEKLKIKEELKLKLKEEREKIKIEKMKLIKDKKEDMKKFTENVVISTGSCSQILKSGINKGNQCKNKVFKDNLCSRHFTSNTHI